jgi:NADH-quinone oxidoreductase subunit M
MGLWDKQPLIAIIAAISIAVTAAYILRAIGRVFFGEVPTELEGHMHDVKFSEKLALTVLCIFMVGIGIFPGIITNLVNAGVNTVLSLLGGA